MKRVRGETAGHKVRRRRDAPRTAAGPCSVCGRRHDPLPLAYGSDAPAAWGDGLQDRDDWMLGEEQCEIGDACYLRGQLLIPVIGLYEPLAWGVWVAVAAEQYERAAELWTTDGREVEPPYRCRLATELPAALYGSTLDVPSLLHTQPVGLRPLVRIADAEHPLAREQRDGITRERLGAIAEQVLHGVDP